MDNDSIKLLHFEDINIDLNYSRIVQEQDKYTCYIRLNRSDSYVCPNCGSYKNKIKEYYEKTITHSTLNNYLVTIKYSARRLYCMDCHISFYETNPFTKAYSRISNFTTFNVLQHLKGFHKTYSSVARENNITTTKVIEIFDCHVECPRGTLEEIMCIDEFYLGRKSKESDMDIGTLIILE